MSDVENCKTPEHHHMATLIPINHASSPSIVITHGTPTRVPETSIEKHMDQEVEQVFREWDENIKCHKQSSYQVRPTSNNSSAAEKRRRRFPNKMTKSVGDTPRNHTARFEFPDVDNIRKEDVNFNTSTESLEDDARRHFYMESPLTGKRMYHMEFDVHGYDQQNISVKVSGSRLIVHAVQQETDTGRKSTTEFCRKVKLPNDVEIQKLQCTFTNGRLVVEAPAPKKLLSQNGTPTFIVTSPRTAEPLNTPTYKDTSAGKCLNLTVELGRIFRADDVLVKVKSKNKLVVQAQREETKDRSKMSASMTREFDLEEKIVPQSLKAGLTADGLLKVSAQVMVEVRVITNGVDDDSSDVNGTATGSEDSNDKTESAAGDKTESVTNDKTESAGNDKT